MRMIDADELIEHVWRDRLDSRERIANLVESMPTIKETISVAAADTVPVAEIYDAGYKCGYEQGKKDEEQDKWVSVSERLPKCEQEVLICTKKKTYIHEKSGFEWCVDPIVTPAMYEDGTMLEVDSKYHWEDCDWAGWDEEEDCGIISEGWWENRHFNPDGEYNHAVDVEVIAWRPLPEAYTEEEV